MESDLPDLGFDFLAGTLRGRGVLAEILAKR